MRVIKFFITLLLSFASASYADIVNVYVPQDFDNIKIAKGVVVAKDGTLKIIDKTNYIKFKSGTMVTFNIDTADKDVLVGAFSQDNNNERKFSTIKTLREYVKDEVKLPVCSNKKADITLLSGQESVLSELVTTRKKRQELLYKEISKLMSEDMIFVLNNLEKYFGLTYDDPLGLELPKEDLLIRLSFLKLAIKNSDAHKLNRVRVEKEAISNTK
ncbi:MAG: hypothetical protein SPJ04_07815 [Bdellovibrionota bacterium]|mgnify:CR=1 FL=1|nr:hypothetical protein [Pseudomonadota bacterium]MDY6091141.1 hypothetical protein [Bdellovibrionota bacterium]